MHSFFRTTGKSTRVRVENRRECHYSLDKDFSLVWHLDEERATTQINTALPKNNKNSWRVFVFNHTSTKCTAHLWQASETMLNGMGNTRVVAQLNGAITMPEQAVSSRLDKMQQRQHQGKRKHFFFSSFVERSLFCVRNVRVLLLPIVCALPLWAAAAGGSRPFVLAYIVVPPACVSPSLSC